MVSLLENIAVYSPIWTIASNYEINYGSKLLLVMLVTKLVWKNFQINCKYGNQIIRLMSRQINV